MKLSTFLKTCTAAPTRSGLSCRRGALICVLFQLKTLSMVVLLRRGGGGGGGLVWCEGSGRRCFGVLGGGGGGGLGLRKGCG